MVLSTQYIFGKKTRKIVMLSVVTLSLSACGFLWGEGALGPADPDNFRQPGQSSHIQTTPLNENDTASYNNGVEIRKPVRESKATIQNMAANTAPTDITTKPASQREIMPAVTTPPEPNTPSLFPAPAPAPALVPASATNNDQRMDRLEQAVQKLQNDLSRIQPALARLAGLETDLRVLVNSLQSINETAAPLRESNAINKAPMSPQPNTAPTTNTPAPQAKKQNASEVVARPRPILDEVPKIEPTKKAGKAIIRSIRSGQYNNKMRLVFDISGDADFTYNLDKNENILTLVFDDASLAQNFDIHDARSGIVSAASMTSNGKDQIANFALNRNSNVLLATTLSPNQDSPYTRIIIDMEK